MLFLFGLLVLVSCVNYIIEKKTQLQIGDKPEVNMDFLSVFGV